MDGLAPAPDGPAGTEGAAPADGEPAGADEAVEWDVVPEQSEEAASEQSGAPAGQGVIRRRRLVAAAIVVLLLVIGVLAWRLTDTGGGGSPKLGGTPAEVVIVRRHLLAPLCDRQGRVRPVGLEPTRFRLEGGCSVQLSYGRGPP